MRKKLGLAAAMLGSPEVLFWMSSHGLDVEMMRKLRHRIEDERNNGRAVLVASHVMSSWSNQRSRRHNARPRKLWLKARLRVASHGRNDHPAIRRCVFPLAG